MHSRITTRPSPRPLVHVPPGDLLARAVPSAGARPADARARAALSATRRRAETLHCIHESRRGPHLAPLSTSRRETSLRAPSPPQAPALPMRAPAPRCQRRAGGRKHCIAFTNHDAALTSPPCWLGAHSARPHPRPRPRSRPRLHCHRRIPCRCARSRRGARIGRRMVSIRRRT